MKEKKVNRFWIVVAWLLAIAAIITMCIVTFALYSMLKAQYEAIPPTQTVDVNIVDMVLDALQPYAGLKVAVGITAVVLLLWLVLKPAKPPKME